jgi:hypothetical protein
MSEREKALEAAAKAVLYHDERGQVLGYSEALDALRTALAMPATVNRARWEAGRDAVVKVLEEAAGVPISYDELLDTIRNLTPPEDAPWAPPPEDQRPDEYECVILLCATWSEKHGYWVAGDGDGFKQLIRANAPVGYAPAPEVTP